MEREQLRALLQDRLSTTDREALDQVWAYLEEKFPDQIDYACAEPETGLEDLVYEAEAPLKFWRLGQGRAKPPGRVRHENVEIELSDIERESAEVASLYLVKRTADLAEVRRFREEELGGCLLSAAQAEEYLRRMDPDYDPKPTLPGQITPRLPRTQMALRQRVSGVEDLSRDELLELLIPSPEADLVFRGRNRELFPGGTAPWMRGSYSWMTPFWVLSGRTPSLEELGIWLATINPWSSQEAAWFVLTGEWPEVVPLELHYHRYRRRFTLTFAPWISEATYRKAYRGARDHLLMGDNRPLSKKTLAAVRFVLESVDEDGTRPSWPELTRRWNKEHPEWRFRSRGGLRKAYQHALADLAGLKMPGLSVPEIVEWRERGADGKA